MVRAKQESEAESLSASRWDARGKREALRLHYPLTPIHDPSLPPIPLPEYHEVPRGLGPGGIFVDADFSRGLAAQKPKEIERTNARAVLVPTLVEGPAAATAQDAPRKYLAWNPELTTQPWPALGFRVLLEQILEEECPLVPAAAIKVGVCPREFRRGNFGNR